MAPDLLMVKQEPTELPGLTAAASTNATATLFPASVVSDQKLASTVLKGETDMSSPPNGECYPHRRHRVLWKPYVFISARPRRQSSYQEGYPS